MKVNLHVLDRDCIKCVNSFSFTIAPICVNGSGSARMSATAQAALAFVGSAGKGTSKLTAECVAQRATLCWRQVDASNGR